MDVEVTIIGDIIKEDIKVIKGFLKSLINLKKRSYR